MLLADIVLVRTQAIEKLLAGPNGARYTDALGTNSDFVEHDEISDNALIIDAEVCNDIISTPGHPARSIFMIPSGNLVSGSFIPAHTGAHGDVQVSIGGVFDYSTPAQSRDEILAMRANPSLYGAASRFHFIEDGVIHHAGDTAKVWYPSFTKTAACQSPQTYEAILIYGTVQLSEKYDQESSFFKKYENLYFLCRKMVMSRVEYIPSQELLEAQIRKEAA